MILNSGQIISSRYEIVDKIGQGGMSLVYRAKDLRLGRFVTFKVLKEEHLTDAEFVLRFRTEASAIASLSHPNIVNVYDVGVEGDINYIVMEYIKGKTLKELIMHNAPFEEKEIYGVSVQVAEALAHAHKNGIIHRDIKPQNILVTKTGTIKVMDFGIARTVNSETITINGSTMGSVHYFSPEQAKGSVVSCQSDLYSLGIVMYEMATGKLPFDAPETITVAIMHINTPLPDIAKINTKISESFIAIVERLTEKRTQNRYPTAERVIMDLKRMLVNSSEKIERKYVSREKGEEIQHAHPDSNKMKQEIKRKRNPDDDRKQDFVEDKADFNVNEEMETELDKLSGEPSKKQEIIVAVAAVATTLVIIVIALFFIIPMFRSNPSDNTTNPPISENSVLLPKFVGLDFEAASKTAQELGISLVKKVEIFDETESGTILEQDPVEGVYVEKGHVVNVAVSSGSKEYEVPPLVNKDINEAYAMLDDNLQVDLVLLFSDTIPVDIVISQLPEAGTIVDKNTFITLTVSKGAEDISATVPKITGFTEDEAKQLLIDAGLQPGTVTTNESSVYEKGKVMAQSILPDRAVPKGSIVNFEVSLGPKESAKPTQTAGTQTAAPTTKTIQISFDFPEGRDSVKVTLCKKTATGTVVVYEQYHTHQDLPIPVTLTGEGSVEYTLFIDDIETGSETIDFSN